MNIPEIHSIKVIEKQIYTGEQPVMVICSDMETYICKYMRSTASAYKLACEYIGAFMAKAWQLPTPDTALVKIKQEHWHGIHTGHCITAPAWGSKQLKDVCDITPSTYQNVKTTVSTLSELMLIALFDFWIANEDRNANNANLLYNIVKEELVSIDYGCIFNTASFDYGMSQLTMTDTILYSDLFHHLVNDKKQTTIDGIVEKLRKKYEESIKRSKQAKSELMKRFPKEWNVPTESVESKLHQLFQKEWINETWDNFEDCLKDNIK